LVREQKPSLSRGSEALAMLVVTFRLREHRFGPCPTFSSSPSYRVLKWGAVRVRGEAMRESYVGAVKATHRHC
jgi:hypothetical protein